MLTSADKSMAEKLMPLLYPAPEISVRLAALLCAYGTGCTFFNVWIQNDFGAALFRLENTFSLLDLGDTDFEEAAFFLNFNPYFKRLTGDYGTVQTISSLLDRSGTLERMNLLRHAATAVNFSPEQSARFEIATQPELRGVFDLIADVLPQESDYPAWYADLSHRIRHGCARAYLLSDGGKPASACLISAESAKAGLISGVATKPLFRGHGNASQLITKVCSDLNACGKIPVLECYDALLSFYEKRGFEKIGEMGELETEQIHSRQQKELTSMQ
jgi:GNAT superfamily N-acetyltransferase